MEYRLDVPLIEFSEGNSTCKKKIHIAITGVATPPTPPIFDFYIIPSPGKTSIIRVQQMFVQMYYN